MQRRNAVSRTTSPKPPLNELLLQLFRVSLFKPNQALQSRQPATHAPCTPSNWDTTSKKYNATYQPFCEKAQVSMRLIRLHDLNPCLAMTSAA